MFPFCERFSPTVCRGGEKVRERSQKKEEGDKGKSSEGPRSKIEGGDILHVVDRSPWNGEVTEVVYGL